MRKLRDVIEACLYIRPEARVLANGCMMDNVLGISVEVIGRGRNFLRRSFILPGPQFAELLERRLGWLRDKKERRAPGGSGT